MNRTVIHCYPAGPDTIVVRRYLDEEKAVVAWEEANPGRVRTVGALEEFTSYTVDLVELNGDELTICTTQDREFALGFAHGYRKGMERK